MVQPLDQNMSDLHVVLQLPQGCGTMLLQCINLSSCCLDTGEGADFGGGSWFGPEGSSLELNAQPVAGLADHAARCISLVSLHGSHFAWHAILSGEIACLVPSDATSSRCKLGHLLAHRFPTS